MAYRRTKTWMNEKNKGWPAKKEKRKKRRGRTATPTAPTQPAETG